MSDAIESEVIEAREEELTWDWLVSHELIVEKPAEAKLEAPIRITIKAPLVIFYDGANNSVKDVGISQTLAQFPIGHVIYGPLPGVTSYKGPNTLASIQDFFGLDHNAPGCQTCQVVFNPAPVGLLSLIHKGGALFDDVCPRFAAPTDLHHKISPISGLWAEHTGPSASKTPPVTVGELRGKSSRLSRFIPSWVPDDAIVHVNADKTNAVLYIFTPHAASDCGYLVRINLCSRRVLSSAGFFAGHRIFKAPECVYCRLNSGVNKWIIPPPGAGTKEAVLTVAKTHPEYDRQERLYTALQTSHKARPQSFLTWPKVEQESVLGSQDVSSTLAGLYLLLDHSLDNSPMRMNYQSSLQFDFTQYSDRVAAEFGNYILMACCGELRWLAARCTKRYQSALPPMTKALARACKNWAREVVWSAIYRLPEFDPAGEFSRAELCTLLRDGFGMEDGWAGGGYGGAKWAAVAELGRRYYAKELSPLLFIDIVVDLVHNGGWAMDKYYGKVHLCHDHMVRLEDVLSIKRYSARKLPEQVCIPKKVVDMLARARIQLARPKVVEAPREAPREAGAYKVTYGVVDGLQVMVTTAATTVTA